MHKGDLSWQAPEFEYWHKPKVWYFALIFISLTFILLALWQGNFLFIVFVMIASLILIRNGSQIPGYIDFRLTDEALVIDDKKSYAYEEFAGFATRRVDDLEDGLSELLLQRKHRLGNYLRVLYPTDRTTEIRHFLNAHLHEIEHEESLIDHLSRWLRF